MPEEGVMPKIILQQAWEGLHRAREAVKYAALVAAELVAELETDPPDGAGCARGLKNRSGAVVNELGELLALCSLMGDHFGVSDPVFIDSAGTLLYGTHQRGDDCDNGCPIHNPSKHPLNDSPLIIDKDYSMIYRRCAHGVKHPDPDHIGYLDAVYGKMIAEVMDEHECCEGACCEW